MSRWILKPQGCLPQPFGMQNLQIEGEALWTGDSSTWQHSKARIRSQKSLSVGGWTVLWQCYKPDLSWSLGTAVCFLRLEADCSSWSGAPLLVLKSGWQGDWSCWKGSPWCSLQWGRVSWSSTFACMDFWSGWWCQMRTYCTSRIPHPQSLPDKPERHLASLQAASHQQTLLSQSLHTQAYVSTQCFYCGCWLLTCWNMTIAGQRLIQWSPSCHTAVEHGFKALKLDGKAKQVLVSTSPSFKATCIFRNLSLMRQLH